MRETLPAMGFADDSKTTRSHYFTLAAQGSLLLGELLALVWLIDRLGSGDWVQTACLGQFLLSMSSASVALYFAATRRRPEETLARLVALVPEIRAGKVPIEELSEIRGRLEPIARHLQDLCHDLKSQRAKLAELNGEIRQRIANRTDALERKIGSLEHQVTRDVLTGLLNRRALNKHLAEAVDRCAGRNLSVSVLMIDVDNFKPLNDTLGHAAGDDLLRSIGQLFRSTIGEKDAAFRCGGDEFVIVLDGSTIDEAQVTAAQLTALVDGLVKTLKVPAVPRLSIGAASLAELATPSAEALLAEADKRLYTVKGDRKRGAPPLTKPQKKSA